MVSSGTKEPSEERAVLDRMEGLVRAMKGQRRDPIAAEPPAEAMPDATDDEDALAEAAWGALNLHLPSTTGGALRGVDDEQSPFERGAIVGRYVILRTLGAGGMGVVHAAYDPELDRKVALKLVRPGMGGEEGRTRLLREAQALAKLSHRNVVAIHDVGTVGEEVWIAMELVRGQTLRQWLEQPRDWREVLAVVRRAGRGLAAAHAAELLHRDFKPENVMVGKKGGVKVMDFGLARARSSALGSMDPDASVEAPVPTKDALATGVTEAGMLVGTPLYMAPEQHLGRELTPAADQFSLCVTLWEALYGERPFGGETLGAVIEAMLAGRLREPPKRRAVPGWLRKVCERGLAVEPERRWASMEALLEALANGQARARMRMGAIVVGALAVLAAGAEGYRRLDVAQRTAACEASGDEIDIAWNAERKQALRDALLATEVSYAPTTAEKVMPWLDAQAGAWREARVEACLDAKVRDQWDARMLDRSLWCLDERRMELESLVDELTLADAEVVPKAVPAAAGLASVAPCRDERVLDALSPPAENDREAVRAVRSAVVWAGNLERAGRYEKGLAVVREALARAEALEWRPLSASARYRLGTLLERTGAYDEAQAALEDSYFEATEGVAPEVVFDAAMELVWVTGVSLAQPTDARRWGRHAKAALAGIRDVDHQREADLSGRLAPIHHAAGAYEDAKTLLERALAIEERVLGAEHPDVAIDLNNLAIIYRATGAHEQARALHERALGIQERVLGAAHPDVARTLGNLANAHQDSGAYEDARVLYGRALSILETTVGPEHPNVALFLTNLAVVHKATGDLEQAKALLERALAIREELLGAEHPDVAYCLANLANVHEAAGDREQAKVLIERALAILEKALGPEHPDVAIALGILASLHEHMRNREAAKVVHERALAILEKALGPEHPEVARPLVGLAEGALAQHRPSEAVALGQRAVAVREKGSVAAKELAEARFVLARALWEAPVGEGRDRARALTLVEQVREALRGAGEGSTEQLAEVEQWLAEHALAGTP